MRHLDIARIRVSLADSIVGNQIHYLQTTGSTMDDARELARQGEREGAVIVAEEQNKGRGRFDRVWVSPPGLNLYFTVILRPRPTQLPYMNMAATLAVLTTAAQFAGLDPSVKWPNDVRVGERKLSGILIETDFEGDRLSHALVGIGINVNLDVSEHPEIADTATSLRSEAGREFDRSDALHSVLKNLNAFYARVTAGESLTADWAATLETLGKRVKLRWRDQVLEGVAESVDDQGNLTLLQPGGERVSVVAGEVTSQV